KLVGRKVQLVESEPQHISGATFRISELSCSLTDGRVGAIGDIVPYEYESRAPHGGGEGVARRIADAARPAGDWNDVEIRCEGRVIQLFLNGREVNRVKGDRVMACHTGFRCVGTDYRLRNIRILPLVSPTQKAAATGKAAALH